MQTKGLFELTVTELEQKAKDLLRRRVDIDHVAPIRIEYLLESTENVELDVIDDLRCRFNIEAFIYKPYMTKTLRVYVDSAIFAGPKANYHCVLGEEWAHLQLHQSLILQVESEQDFVDLQNDPEWPRFEQDARYFSAAIRMPCDLLLHEANMEYGRVVAEHGFGDPAAVEKLLRNRLAQRFVVPNPEMAKRMKEWPCGIRSRVFSSLREHRAELRPVEWSLSEQPTDSHHQLFRLD
jgi:hypothetical protein